MVCHVKGKWPKHWGGQGTSVDVPIWYSCPPKAVIKLLLNYVIFPLMKLLLNCDFIQPVYTSDSIFNPYESPTFLYEWKQVCEMYASMWRNQMVMTIWNSVYSIDSLDEIKSTNFPFRAFKQKLENNWPNVSDLLLPFL